MHWITQACGALALMAATPLLPLRAQDAPPGWTAREADGAQVYTLDRRDDVELRLYPADPDPRDLDTYLADLVRRGVHGLGAVDFSAPRDLMGMARMAVGLTRSGESRVVAVIACETAGDTKRAGTLLLPPDPDLMVPFLADAGMVVAQACLDPALAGAAPARPAAPPDPQDAPPVPFTGTPLDEAGIAGVLYSWTQVYEVTGLQFVETTYLLLQDGTARDGIPDAAPAEFDVAADRTANPDLWGTWRERWRGDIEVTFADGPFIPERQLRPVPGRAGERLAGRFEKSTSHAIADVASWSNWGLDLAADGTFERWRSGGSGGGAGAATTLSVGDDFGSASSASSGPFAGGGRTSTGVTEDDLRGTYHIDGWTMELRYRNGTVTRGFFYTSEDRTDIWFEGHELSIRQN
ncbi:MAG: hypothetical protein MUF73_08655 [Rhodobacteraceae bacterium]|jgi:hypothetical protein|nr:hypothetical protein [Paracoccaceae bacterium]